LNLIKINANFGGSYMICCYSCNRLVCFILSNIRSQSCIAGINFDFLDCGFESSRQIFICIRVKMDCYLFCGRRIIDRRMHIKRHRSGGFADRVPASGQVWRSLRDHIRIPEGPIKLFSRTFLNCSPRTRRLAIELV